MKGQKEVGYAIEISNRHSSGSRWLWSGRLHGHEPGADHAAGAEASGSGTCTDAGPDSSSDTGANASGTDRRRETGRTVSQMV